MRKKEERTLRDVERESYVLYRTVTQEQEQDVRVSKKETKISVYKACLQGTDINEVKISRR